jgi:SIR2-like domain
MRIAVLAGSGLSMRARYPSTATLTETILSGEGVFRHTDSTYYLGVGGAPVDATVLGFLHRLVKLVSDYHGSVPARPVTYEDLAYIAGQLADSLSGDYDNPALAPLHDALRADFGEGQSALRLATETLHYITDVVWRSLKDERVASYLGPFIDFVKDERLDDVTVFTLNHDTLLERTFRTADVEFADGFGDPVNGVRYWQPERFGEVRPARRLVKLHGSVDWFLLRPDGGELHEERIAQVTGDPEHTLDAKGRLQNPGDGRPLLLVGTHNKARGYLNPPFFDAHIEFYRRLIRERAEIVVVIGYGGQDKGINERIVDWMESDLTHRLVIVNKSEGILEHARGSLRGFDFGDASHSKGFPRWRYQRRFELVARPLEEVGVADWTGIIQGPTRAHSRLAGPSHEGAA